jgi:hypothetical protein
MFLQWLALPGVQLYSLQKGPPEAELKALPTNAPKSGTATISSNPDR